MTAIQEFLVALQILETGGTLIMAFSLLAIALHEVWGSNGWWNK